MSDWAGLLPELLNLIFKRIDSLDFLSLGKVCSTWRSFSQNFPKPKRPFPWLMLAENKNNNEKGVREFYSLTEKKIYSLALPELKDKMCIETKGWLLTLSEMGEINLVHPLTRDQISLPHVNTFKNYEEEEISNNRFVERAVLSSSPTSSEEYVIMVICGHLRELGYWRSGDKTWNVIDYYIGAFKAIEYYRGKFYAINVQGEVWECDVFPRSSDSNPSESMRMIGSVTRELMHRGKQIYIAGSGGHLLFVTRYNRYGRDNESPSFKVYKFYLGQERLTKMKNLGTKSIFLGHSATLCIETKKFSGLINPNSIYFTEDDWVYYLTSEPEGGGKDMAIYNLRDKSLCPHYGGKSFSNICPPIWTFLTITG